MEKPEARHILICPLDWGLGHATRMAQVVRFYLAEGHRVTVGGSMQVKEFMHSEFEDKINYVNYPGYNVSYSRSSNLALKLSWQLPLITYWLFREHYTIRKIAKKIKPDLIISDNRYGARVKKIPSIFITHQTTILMPLRLKWMQKLVNHVNHHLISRFHKCIVPDHEMYPGLAGDLSHGAALKKLVWCGPLSRFSDYGEQHWQAPPFDVPPPFILVILSGPEPQRTLLQEKLKEQLKDQTAIWFLGLPGNRQVYREGKHIYFNHGSTRLMGWCIRHSRLVICRSGYSSVMDLAVFGKKTVFIPTPGQTEQEYLASQLSKQGFTTFLNQNGLNNIQDAILQTERLSGLPKWQNNTQASAVFRSLLMGLPERTPSQNAVKN